MRFVPLIWRNLLRRKARTTFTFLCVLVAFLLFGVLAAIRTAFTLGVELTGRDRLILLHKISLIQPLPLSYRDRIQAIPGVVDVAHASWFGGIYQDPKYSMFAQLPVEPERYLRLYPEFQLPPEQKKAWLETRNGAVVGRKTAEQFGWKVGDRVPIQPTIWRKRQGGAWEFIISGIYDVAEKGGDNTQFLFHYDYFDETREFGEGLVGWYIIRINDPQRAVEIAKRIDATFANSAYETETSTEKAFIEGFSNQIGDIGAIITAIASAVFFTVLLVAGNTMAQSIRERTNELAVLKTLGYSNQRVLALVLLESCALTGLAGLFGLGAAWMLITVMGDPTGGFLPTFYIPRRYLLMGVGFVATLGLASGILPALRA
ncbi:MAG: ABC transporter permease, partial [Acidimicrobiia bacterium]